jgi:hypothetical protein
MTASEPQEETWLSILREINLDSLFSQRGELTFLLGRLDEFGAAYSRCIVGARSGGLPPSASREDVLAEYERNPHRVRTLLQAAAFRCSPQILTMMWATMLGGRIESLTYGYERGKTSALTVVVVFPDGTTKREFRSDEIWDLALFRLATVAEADEAPLIEDFYPIWIPPQRPWNHDLYVVDAKTGPGDFAALDVAPVGSAFPRWEIHQVFAKQPPRLVGAVDVHAGGSAFVSASQDSDRPILERAWQALKLKYGEEFLVRLRKPRGT